MVYFEILSKSCAAVGEFNIARKVLFKGIAQLCSREREAQVRGKLYQRRERNKPAPKKKNCAIGDKEREQNRHSRSRRTELGVGSAKHEWEKNCSAAQ